MSTQSAINAAVVGLKNLRVCEFVKNSPLRQVVKSGFAIPNASERQLMWECISLLNMAGCRTTN